MSNDKHRFLMTLVVDDEVHAVQSVSFEESANPTLMVAALTDLEDQFIKKHVKVNTERVTDQQLSLFDIREET